MAAVEADASRRASEALEIVGPVPKKGSSRSTAWTADEALCVGKGWGQTTTDPVLGTCQGKQAFYDKMVVNIRVLMIKADLPELDKRLERSNKRIERMFRYEITNAVHKLNGCLIFAHQRELTGSPTEADMAAVALYNNKDPYAGVRREEAATQFLFYLKWTYPRHFLKFSPEESINTLKKMRYKVYGDSSLTATDDKETVSGGRKRPPSAAGLTDLPVGTKAAKAAMRRNAQEAQPHIRATPEGEAWLRGQLQRRLRVTGATAGGAASTEDEDQVKDVEVVELPRRDEPNEQTTSRAASAAARAASLKAEIEASRRSGGYDVAKAAAERPCRARAAAGTAATRPTRGGRADAATGPTCGGVADAATPS